MSRFMDMSRSISEEFNAGRISLGEAKGRLGINADIAVLLEIRRRSKIWKRLVRHRDLVWDSEQERYAVCEVPWT